MLHIQISHRCELLGSSCIENLEQHIDIVDADQLAVAVLNCWIILLEKYSLYELYGKS